ncbi:antigen peptide transporter 1 [Rhinophrynus dorsalis]
MHPMLTLCSIIALDCVSLPYLKLSLACFLPQSPPLLLLPWVVGLARFVVLTLEVQMVIGWSSLPSWLRGEALFLSSVVLCLLVPSGAALTTLVSPQSSVNLIYSWGRWEVCLLCYLFTLTAAILWHQLCPPSEEENGSGKAPSASLGRLLDLLRPYVLRFLFVAVFLVLSSWSEMALPSYTGRMTDWIADKKDPSAFTTAITAMSLITIASAVTEFVCDCMYNITMSMIHARTQGQLLRSILRQEMAFFDSVRTGDIISRVTTDTIAMSESLTSELSLLMWYLMRLVFLSVYMVLLSPKLTLFTVLCLGVITLVPKLSGTFYQNLAIQVQESLSKANQVALETFSNMKTVRSFANEEGECQRYEMKLQDTYQLNKMEAFAYGCSAVANSFSGLALKVGILYFGGRLVTNGEVSGGELVSFVLYELQFSTAVEVLLRMYPDVKKAVGSSEKVFEYMDRIPHLPAPGTLSPHNLNGVIQFKNVTFSYPTRPDTPALENVSFELHPGQVTALVGPCDAGKTTVVQLLLRFYEPQNGEILLDGEPLAEYENQYYRKKVSVVSQEPALSARSLKDNISYGMGEVPLGSIQAAAQKANAHSFINEMKNGYQTGAGQKGGLLSVGQKQRVAIARALLRDPKILILDDATSSLDTESEHKVQHALYDGSRHRTVLLISHRLNTVQRADRILVLEGGRITEQGTHKQLLQLEGSYRKLWNKQCSSFQRGNGGQQDAE